MSEFRIRQMLASDLQHVAPLYREMVLEETVKGPQYPNFDDLDKEIEDFTFQVLHACKGPRNIWNGFVALDGKVAKGFAMTLLINRVVGRPRFYALGEVLFVTKNFRHKGLGEQLVRSMAEWAVAQGAGALEVVYKPGSDAHKQWARMGFRSYSTSAVFATKELVPILDYPEFKAPKDEPKMAVGES